VPHAASAAASGTHTSRTIVFLNIEPLYTFDMLCRRKRERATDKTSDCNGPRLAKV
jgi:hypothetical protein